MMHPTVDVLFVEAAAFVIAGFIARLMYESWKVVIATQNASAACGVAGYAIEARLPRRRRRGGR
jgi:hypothetical protein